MSVHTERRRGCRGAIEGTTVTECLRAHDRESERENGTDETFPEFHVRGSLVLEDDVM